MSDEQGAAGRPANGSTNAPDGKRRRTPRIIVLGGGSVGLYAARRLHRRLGRHATVVLVDPRPYMTYFPFLPEVAAGTIEARDVVAPHRLALRGIDVLQGRVVRINHARRSVTIRPEEGEDYSVGYDHVVIGLGSVSRTLPIPGLAENGIGFKNVEEAIALRNHVINRMDVASSTWDADLRRRMLTFTFVGAGFAGIEAIAELEDMAMYATRNYPTIEPRDLRFVMVEGSDRILPELSAPMGRYAKAELAKRGIDVKLNTFLSSCVDGHVVLSDGEEFASETIVWTAGIKAHPVIAEASDLPTDDLGRVTVSPTLQVIDERGAIVDGAWAAGDCAAVPDVHKPGSFIPPNAQHAIREATRLAENLVAVLVHKPLDAYRHQTLGTVASLGLYKGVAELFGFIRLRGLPAWAMHRIYHVLAMPTGNRRLRIMIAWIGQFLLGRELVSLGSVQDPRSEFRRTVVPVKKGGSVVQRAQGSASVASQGRARRG